MDVRALRAAGRRRPGLSRLARFGLVGALDTGLDAGTFAALMLLYPPGRDSALAALYAVVGWAVASLAGYRFHSRFTFRARMPAPGFYAVALAGVGVQAGTTAWLTAAAGPGGAWGGKLAGIALASGLTYLGYRALARRAPALRKTPGVPDRRAASAPPGRARPEAGQAVAAQSGPPSSSG